MNNPYRFFTLSFPIALLFALLVAVLAAPSLARAAGQCLALLQAKNYKGAYSICLDEAKAGDASAQNNLGVMYHKGYGTSKNPKEALKWYSAAAEQGFAGAQYNLGRMYHRGEAVEKDVEEAFKLYRTSAKKGHTGAQGVLGLMYYKGEGTAKNVREAYIWLLLATARGGQKNSQQIKKQVRRELDKKQIAAAEEEAKRRFKAMIK